MASLADPNHWYERAVQARRLAEQITNLEARAEMMKIAEGYERIACMADSRAK